jgi:hypothetical protein
MLPRAPGVLPSVLTTTFTAARSTLLTPERMTSLLARDATQAAPHRAPPSVRDAHPGTHGSLHLNNHGLNPEKDRA